MFYQHIDFYMNKSISTVKCIKILGNSNCGINPLQKCLLYRSYILPIALYRFQLWFYNHASMAYHLKVLGKMQSVVATTRRNGTRSMLTSAKLTEGYLVVGFTRELDKEPSLYSSTIYTHGSWSVLQQYLSGP